MPALIAYLIFPLGVSVFLWRSRSLARRLDFYLFALTFKIIAAFGMTYLIINQYEFGDFPTYFTYAKETAEDLVGGRLDTTSLLLPGSYVVAHLNALLFTVLPASVYGLSILSGCAAFVYSALIVTAVERHFAVPAAARVLIFLSPILSMQSGYVGKETYVLPLIGLIVFWLSQDRTGAYWKVILLIVMIGAIRPYQIFFFLIPLIVAWIAERGNWRRGLVGLVFLAVAAFLANEQFVERSGGEIAFEEFLSVTYSGGSMVLEPYVFPFSVLQNFRPFPWEARDLPTLVASLESGVFLIFSLWLALQRTAHRPRDWSPAQRRLGAFLAASVLLYLVAFGFSSNLGDLSRRHVYYYPFLLLMLCRPRAVAQKTAATMAFAKRLAAPSASSA